MNKTFDVDAVVHQALQVLCYDEEVKEKGVALRTEVLKFLQDLRHLCRVRGCSETWTRLCQPYDSPLFNYKQISWILGFSIRMEQIVASAITLDEATAEALKYLENDERDTLPYKLVHNH